MENDITATEVSGHTTVFWAGKAIGEFTKLKGGKYQLWGYCKNGDVTEDTGWYTWKAAISWVVLASAQ